MAAVKPQALNMLLAVVVTYMMLATALLAPFAWPACPPHATCVKSYLHLPACRATMTNDNNHNLVWRGTPWQGRA